MKRYTINRIFAHLVGNISAHKSSLFRLPSACSIQPKFFSETLDFGWTVANLWQPVHVLNGVLDIHCSAYISMNGISDDHCWRVLYECHVRPSQNSKRSNAN